jgi:hypothetical protein
MGLVSYEKSKVLSIWLLVCIIQVWHKYIVVVTQTASIIGEVMLKSDLGPTNGPIESI